MEKLVWVAIILFCKISFPVTHLMPYYARTGRSHPVHIQKELVEFLKCMCRVQNFPFIEVRAFWKVKCSLWQAFQFFSFFPHETEWAFGHFFHLPHDICWISWDKWKINKLCWCWLMPFEHVVSQILSTLPLLHLQHVLKPHSLHNTLLVKALGENS